MKRCLIIFAKEPLKNRVKTRLSKYLPASFSFLLYKAFIKDTVELASRVNCQTKIMAYDTEGRREARFLKKSAPGFRFFRQQGRNLGRRMHNAFCFARSIGATRTIIIGSDAPNLPPQLISEAFDKLHRNDVVIGPSMDGGYYLIGLKKPCPRLFEGIEWSFNTVLRHSIKRAKSLKIRTTLLKEWYDVDEAWDLERLKADLKRNRDRKVARWTRDLLDK